MGSDQRKNPIDLDTSADPQLPTTSVTSTKTFLDLTTRSTITSNQHSDVAKSEPASEDHLYISLNPSAAQHPGGLVDYASRGDRRTPILPSTEQTVSSKEPSRIAEPFTRGHSHISTNPSTEHLPATFIDSFTESGSLHPTTLTHLTEASPSLIQKPGPDKQRPPSSPNPQPGPPPRPQDWVDPLLLSPLTSSSHSSSLRSVDPLEDWDGTLPESPEGWVDPLIADPLSTDSSSTSTSSSPEPSRDPSPNETSLRKRKRTQSASSTNTLCSESPSSASGRMPEDGHQGKNAKLPKIPKDATWVKGRLEAYGMFQNDREAYKRYPQFAISVGKIINRERKSHVGPNEFEDFQFTLEVYKSRNEDSVLAALLPFIIKPDRTVQVPKPTEYQRVSKGENQTTPPTDEDLFEVKAFVRSGLVTLVNCDFARTFLPFRDDDLELDKEVVNISISGNGFNAESF